MIGPDEWATYPELDQEGIAELFPKVYDKDGVAFYAVSQRARTQIQTEERT
jgi:hypothetical protein